MRHEFTKADHRATSYNLHPAVEVKNVTRYGWGDVCSDSNPNARAGIRLYASPGKAGCVDKAWEKGVGVY